MTYSWTSPDDRRLRAYLRKPAVPATPAPTTERRSAARLGPDEQIWSEHKRRCIRRIRQTEGLEE